MLFCEIFDVWGIDFKCLFLVSFCFVYKRLKAKVTQTHDSFIIEFVRSHIFASMLCLKLTLLIKLLIKVVTFIVYSINMEVVLRNYGVIHKVSTS